MNLIGCPSEGLTGDQQHRFQSGAALATVVGVLVEVPVMLSVVWIVLRTRGWYEHARTV